MTLLTQALKREQVVRPPVWFMRQAGRYLPEYRKVRAGFTDFIQFCLTPDAAAKVTLQPIDQFGMDAAILFADILTIPHALGHTVTFTEGHGPRVVPITSTKDVTVLAERLENVSSLQPVAETVRLVRRDLAKDKALIGFCGGPFTLACYMLDEKPSLGIPNTLRFMEEHPRSWQQLLDVLTAACVAYLSMQVKAGADALQIFDSWAGACPSEHWKQAVYVPLVTMGRAVKAVHPDIPIIAFPRLATQQQLLAVRDGMGGALDALSLSTETDLAWAAKTLQPRVTIQGNLCPTLFVNATGGKVEAAVRRCLDLCAGNPGYIVNLGHGFTPDTDIGSVQLAVDLIKAYR